MGVLPMMDYTGMLRPKEVPFLGSGYGKGVPQFQAGCQFSNFSM